MSATDFLDNIKKDLAPNNIYTFTPRGKIIHLPAKATPIDFAYTIHADVGNINESDIMLAVVSNAVVLGFNVKVDEGAQELAARTGNWSSLPTGPDWMLWLRRPPLGGGREKPRALLAGDCNGFALADFMAYLGQSRFTGGLRITSGSAERTLWMKDGEVRSANSDANCSRLS